MSEEIKQAILEHRKASMELGRVMYANGRRGASAEATNEINRAGERMAKSERDLLALLTPQDRTTGAGREGQ